MSNSLVINLAGFSQATLRGYPMPVRLDFGSYLQKMTAKEFAEICQRNPDLRFERTKEGDVIVMPPVQSETGGRNFELVVELGSWARRDGTGKGFDSSTGFTLPNGAVFSPDASWILRERWDALQPAQKRSFAPICPDFVVEIRSATDVLKTLKDKMAEYIANGVQLGWLLDPKKRKVYIYRPGAEVEILDNPAHVSGEPLLHGFVLDLQQIWD